MRELRGLFVVVLAVLLGWSVYRQVPEPPSEAVVDPVPEETEAVGRAGMAKVTSVPMAPGSRKRAQSRGLGRLPGTPRAPQWQGDAPEAPVPPEGYLFVTTQGEMSKGRLEPMEPVPEGEEEHDPDQAWLEAPDASQKLVDQAAALGRDWTFGWVRVRQGENLTDLSNSLRRLGVEVLGESGDLLRARLPGSEELLRAVAELPGVSGLGATPRIFKLGDGLADQVRSADPGERIPVFITLMPEDPRGRWRGELEDLGAVLTEYNPDIRVYAAEVDSGVLEVLAEADFVLSIETVSRVEAAHDTAVPAMGADALRVYDDSTGLFSGIGGASVPIGVMDTGLNLNHPDISSGRESVCGGNFANRDPATSDQDLWIDEHGHGTHVTGTMVGNGHQDPGLAGMAPLVRHLRFAKVLHHLGIGDGAGVGRGMDYLAEPSSCGVADGSSAAVKALVVNMSLAATSTQFQGRSTDERKLDSIVWKHRQLYVVAQANAGVYGFSNYAAAKNSLAVGAVEDNGELAFFSSHGPTKDGRLAPQVMGTGVALRSPRGQGNRGGYVTLSGTSMAAPSVAGVAALLMDAAPDFREQPALVRARLMASAIKPDAYLEDPDRFAPNNTNGPAPLQNRYGLGKVSARASVLDRDLADGWVNGNAVTELAEGEYAYQDIEVPENASRLDVVMTWDEAPADTIASSVLNDLDLWVDQGADCETAACGEYASRSRIDNVEWVIMQDPVPGTYRIKTIPHRSYATPPRVAVAWTVIRGSSKPALQVSVDQPVVNVLPDQTYEVDLTVTSDAYIADGVTLRIDCRGENGSGSTCSEERLLAAWASRASREDGLSRSLGDDFVFQPSDPRRTIALGEIAVGETQRIKLVFRRAPENGAFRLYFTASGWNAMGDSASVEVRASGEGGAALPEAERPENDDFSLAANLDGSEGEREFDLLLATPDPSEPPLESVIQIFLAGIFDAQRRPERSVWYTWTASENGLFRFKVGERDTSIPTEDELQQIAQVQLDVFEGDRIVSLAPVASQIGGSLIFAAQEGKTYRIRLSALIGALGWYQQITEVSWLRRITHHHVELMPSVLSWSPAIRPANDDFRFATSLEGATGSIGGDNDGATLEPGEQFGPMAATVWYRWTAPSDGRWSFQVSRKSLNVVVFDGEDVSELRFLSGYPTNQALFPVRQGKQYRIAVASSDAETSGAVFELSWFPDHRQHVNNDYFAGATVIDNAESSSGSFWIHTGSTVEPGEPIETESRTTWWIWTAPKDGEYTWRPELRRQIFDGRSSWIRISDLLKLAAFRGENLDGLHLVASSLPGIRSVPEMKFNAQQGVQYRIAAGMVGETAFTEPGVGVQLNWGLAPVNDDLGSATPITDAAGSVSGSNRFATLDPDARAGIRSYAFGSVWWSWTAPASGWYRFWLQDSSGILEIYSGSGDDFASLQLVTTNDIAEAIFQAEPEATYTIRFRSDVQEEFTLHWSEHAAPAWLRYVGQYADGDIDAAGSVIDLPEPGKMAFNTEGTELYVLSEAGLLVFERNPESGRLTWAQTVREVPIIWTRSTLLWDSHRSRLYERTYCKWQGFIPREGSVGLEYEGNVPGGDCDRYGADVTLFMDSTGSFLHVVDPEVDQIKTYAVNASGNRFRHVENIQVDQLKHGIISSNDLHVYTVTEESLVVFERNANTGRLSLALALRNGDLNDEGPPIDGLSSLEEVTVAGKGRYLFTSGSLTEGTSVFDLHDDPSNPRFLGSFRHSWDVAWPRPPEWFVCRNTVARDDRPVIDLFCQNGEKDSWALSLEWEPESGQLLVTDFLESDTTDRFGNLLPGFKGAGFLGSSPDGRHLYFSSVPWPSYNGQILVFERVGNEPMEADSEE